MASAMTPPPMKDIESNNALTSNLRCCRINAIHTDMSDARPHDLNRIIFECTLD